MLIESLRRRAELDGDREFLVFGERSRTFRQVHEATARVAGYLLAQGVRPGERVLLVAGNSPLYCLWWFGLRRAGAVCVPLHLQATAEHATAVVGEAEITRAVTDAAGERLLAGLGLDLAVSSFPDAEALEDRVADVPPADGGQSGDGASLLYTSGTTGRPKGVALSDEAMMTGAAELAAAIGITRDDRILLCLPLYHANPQIYGIGVALHTGCAVAIVPRFSASGFWDQARAHRATAFTYVGTVLSLLARQPPPADHRVRWCVGGGAPLPAWEHMERCGIRVHELYGMTETGGWVTANTVDRYRKGTCGPVRPDMDCIVVDEHDHPVAPGGAGEIVVRPRRPSVLFDGYFRRPELTLSRMRNLWFHTGDRGMFDADGYLTFLGRVDSMIRRGGENILAQDVERVLADHPAVQEVAVVGVPDAVLGQEIRAVVVLRAELDLPALIGQLARRLPPAARPRYLAVVPALPKTATEKVQTALLGEVSAADIDLATVGPRTRS